MKQRFLLLLLCFGLVGCGTTLTSIRQQSMPINYQSDIDDILRRIESKVGLRYKYVVRVVPEGSGTKSPQMKPEGADRGVIYLEDVFVKYLYNEPYGWVYRKRNLACIIVHEMAHREYGLPDSPIETHLQVDLKAIEMLGKIGIDWVGYSVAFAELHKYMGIRNNGNEMGAFLKTIAYTGVALTIGFSYSESDAFNRVLMLGPYFEPNDRGWHARRNAQTIYLREHKQAWDFPS